MNMLDYRMSPQQAGDQARAAHDGGSTPWGGPEARPGTVLLEHGISVATARELGELGHDVQFDLGAAGGYQAIWRTDSPLVYFGGSDPRKDGGAFGY